MNRTKLAIMFLCMLLGATPPMRAQDKQAFFELDLSKTILKDDLSVVKITTFDPSATQSRSMEITWNPKNSEDTIFITVVSISQCKFKSDPSGHEVRFRVFAPEQVIVNSTIADEAPNKYLGNRDYTVLVTLTLPAETIAKIINNDI